MVIEIKLFFFPAACCANCYDTELYSRSTLKRSLRISNPGCYATSTQLLLAPLLPYLDPLSSPTVFGLSGYSGAGTKAGQLDSEGRPTTLPKVSAESLGGGVKSYSLTDHIHEREAGYHLSHLPGAPDGFKVAFIPNISPWFSGIISVVSAPLKDRMTANAVKELYENTYKGEGLIRVGTDVVQLKDVEGKHGWKVGGIQVHSSGKRVVVTVCVFVEFQVTSINV